MATFCELIPVYWFDVSVGSCSLELDGLIGVSCGADARSISSNNISFHPLACLQDLGSHRLLIRDSCFSSSTVRRNGRETHPFVAEQYLLPAAEPIKGSCFNTASTDKQSNPQLTHSPPLNFTLTCWKQHSRGHRPRTPFMDLVHKRLGF